MKLWDRCASHNSTCSRHGKRKGSSPNRVVQKRGDPQGGVSLLWVLAFGLAVVVITEKFVFQSLRKHHLGAAEREAERQQHAMVVMEDGIAASRYRGNDRAGAVVVHVNGPRDDNHLSAAKQPRAAPLQAAGTVEKSAESTALRAFLGRNGQSGLVAETVAGNVEKGRRNLESISGTIHTLTRLREGECTVKDCRVLITGCGRSGTHYLSRELMRAGVPMEHESIGPLGAVSWMHAAPFRPETAALEARFANVSTVERRSSPQFQFFPIFHLVRHPLAVISSMNECFCACGSLSCGRRGDLLSWRWAGYSIKFSNRLCTRTDHDNVCLLYDNADGRILRAMEYWLKWNQLAGSQAQYRIQLETVVLTEVVAAVPQLYNSIGGADAVANIKQRPFASKRRRQEEPRTPAVTWLKMRSVDPVLENKIWKMAKSYGYSRRAP